MANELSSDSHYIGILIPKDLSSYFDSTSRNLNSQIMIEVPQKIIDTIPLRIRDPGPANIPPPIPPDMVMDKPMRKAKLKEKVKANVSGGKSELLLS